MILAGFAGLGLFRQHAATRLRARERRWLERTAQLWGDARRHQFHDFYGAGTKVTRSADGRDSDIEVEDA